jgi:hypothetical protein
MVFEVTIFFINCDLQDIRNVEVNTMIQIALTTIFDLVAAINREHRKAMAEIIGLQIMRCKDVATNRQSGN